MKEDRHEESDAEQGLWVAAGEYAGYGLTWALSVLVFLLAGWWLDGKIGTVPLFTLAGAFLGGAAGFYSLYRHVVAAGRPEEPKGSDEASGPSGRT